MAPTVRRFVRWYFSERRSSGVDVVFYYFSNRCAKKLTKPQFNPSLRKSQRVREARHHLQRHHSSCCRSIHNRALSCHSAFYYALCVCASVRVCVCKCLSGPSVCSWFNSSVFSLSAWQSLQKTVSELWLFWTNQSQLQVRPRADGDVLHITTTQRIRGCQRGLGSSMMHVH